MRLRIVAFALGLISFSHLAYGCDSAAGVVAFSKLDDQILILMADHKINHSRGWAAFGGCVDAGESIRSAALRELHEETRCGINQPLTLSDQTLSVSFGKFTSFALEITYLPAASIGAEPISTTCSSPVFDERGPWAWVALNEVLAHISDDNPTQKFRPGFMEQASHRWFWPKSTRVIKALSELGAFE